MLRNQKALLFCADRLGRNGPDKYGRFRYVVYPLLVRWELKRELYIDENGETKTSNSVVYLNDVYRDESKEQFRDPNVIGGATYTIRPGDYLILGEADDDQPNASLNPPKDYPGASKVMAVSITPNLSNTKRVVKVWL